jgi:hypothetical protein
VGAHPHERGQARARDAHAQARLLTGATLTPTRTRTLTLNPNPDPNPNPNPNPNLWREGFERSAFRWDERDSNIKGYTAAELRERVERPPRAVNPPGHAEGAAESMSML